MMIAIATLNDRLIFFVGLNTGFVAEGKPDKRYVEFYRERSSPHLHCAIIGNVVVPGGHGTNRVSPILSRDEVWAEIASSISASGSLAGIQLATTWINYEGSRTFLSPHRHQAIRSARQVVADLGRDGLSSVLDSFERAAVIALDHGFTHIQVHAAHGYLPGLMIDRRINPDADWSIERLSLLSIRLREKNVETSIRISLRTGDQAFDQVGSDGFHDEIASLPFSFIDLSSGYYNIDKRLIYPAIPSVLETRWSDAVSVARRHPSRSFILSGRAMTRHVDGLPSNVNLGICRDLIANPRFLSDRGNGCRNYGKCHYFSRGDEHVTCPQWVFRND